MLPYSLRPAGNFRQIGIGPHLDGCGTRRDEYRPAWVVVIEALRLNGNAITMNNHSSVRG